MSNPSLFQQIKVFKTMKDIFSVHLAFCNKHNYKQNI